MIQKIDANKRTVFLIGPMRGSGITREAAMAWRHEAINKLSANFNVLHAYRGREEKETFTDPRGAVIRDKNDILRADVIMLNDSFKNATMIGTAMEVLFAFEHNKPIIAFGAGHVGNYWLDTHIHTRTENFDEACDLIKKLFVV